MSPEWTAAIVAGAIMGMAGLVLGAAIASGGKEDLWRENLLLEREVAKLRRSLGIIPIRYPDEWESQPLGIGADAHPSIYGGGGDAA